MSGTDKMLARKEGRVGTMIFNNPEKLNAVSFEMWEAGWKIMEDFAADPEVRVVVITGAGGKSFVSGADISKFADERAGREAVARYNAAVEQIYAGIHAFPKPTIAMIRGYCIGGGMGLAASCDMRVCSANSRFALPAAKLGLGYGFPAVKRLADIVGPAWAKDIFFTARQFGAEEALRIGYVNRVVGEDELEKTVSELAATIAANAPLTVNSVKRIVNETRKDPADRDLEECRRLVQACFESQDYIEGRQAFTEKRKPAFQGR
jgi:enoyl-CoA hydratase/carnithine racemase